jgi:hypothetical protein
MEDVTAVRPLPDRVQPRERWRGRSRIRLKNDDTALRHDAGHIRQLRVGGPPGIRRIGEHDVEALVVFGQSPDRPIYRAGEHPDLGWLDVPVPQESDEGVRIRLD